MLKILAFLIAISFTQFAQADWAYEFLHVTCLPKVGRFEAKVTVLYGLNDIQFEFDEAKTEEIVKRYAREKALYLVAGYDQEISCKFIDGTHIDLKTKPNQSNEHNLFPGAAATLKINDHIVFENLSFPTDCERSLDAVVIDKKHGSTVSLIVRNNAQYSPFTELPRSATFGWRSRYSSTKDVLRIRNCRKK